MDVRNFIGDSFQLGCYSNHIEVLLCVKALICVFLILGIFTDEVNSAVAQSRRIVGGGEHISTG